MVGRSTQKYPYLTTKSKYYIRTYRYEYYNTFQWLLNCKKKSQYYWPFLNFFRLLKIRIYSQFIVMYVKLINLI